MSIMQAVAKVGDPAPPALVYVAGTFSAEPPVGGATEAKQDTANTTLAAIQTAVEAQRALSKATTATLSNVAGSATSVTLLAANANRLGVLLVNDSTAILYLKYGATASATSFSVKLEAGSYWEMPRPIYPGVIDGIWASANGAARLTELT